MNKLQWNNFKLVKLIKFSKKLNFHKYYFLNFFLIIHYIFYYYTITTCALFKGEYERPYKFRMSVDGPCVDLLLTEVIVRRHLILSAKWSIKWLAIGWNLNHVVCVWVIYTNIELTHLTLASLDLRQSEANQVIPESIILDSIGSAGVKAVKDVRVLILNLEIA